MLLFWLILLALIKWGYHARQLGGWVSWRQQREDYVGAAWSIGMVSYSSFSETVLKLLDCRKIGDEWYMYFAASNKCFHDYHGWEYVLFFLLVVVIAFPVYMYFHFRQQWYSH